MNSFSASLSLSIEEMRLHKLDSNGGDTDLFFLRHMLESSLQFQ